MVTPWVLVFVRMHLRSLKGQLNDVCATDLLTNPHNNLSTGIEVARGHHALLRPYKQKYFAMISQRSSLNFGLRHNCVRKTCSSFGFGTVH